NYIDPQDDSRAQFIVGSLRPGTEYNFRVRTYAGSPVPEFRSYSNTASAMTARYELRYVAPAGNDSNDGLSPDPAHAWRMIYRGSFSLGCGQALIVMGGSYANDGITMQQSCPANNKAVVMANPGDSVTITSMGSVGIYHPILLLGTHIVIDGVH